MLWEHEARVRFSALRLKWDEEDEPEKGARGAT